MIHFEKGPFKPHTSCLILGLASTEEEECLLWGSDKRVLTLPNASKTESKYSNTPKSRKNMPKPDKPTPISTAKNSNKKVPNETHFCGLVFLECVVFFTDAKNVCHGRVVISHLSLV